MFELIKEGNVVKLQTDNEWNNLFGIVEKIENDIAYIFCSVHPGYYYEIHRDWNENEIILYPNLEYNDRWN